MTISATTTVREVVVTLPQSTRVFEKLKIDYCCGGGTPLMEACTKAGVEFQQLEQMLEQVTGSQHATNNVTDFNSVPLPELIDHILEKHHVFTKDEMARLEPLFAKVVSVHGQNHPELHRAQELFVRLCVDLGPHMFKEEQILFPYISAVFQAQTNKRPAPFAPFGTVNNPVRMMRVEHDDAGDVLKELRAITNNYTVPADVCISYKTLYEALEGFEQDLHQHIHLENNILFPRAVEAEESACRS